MRILLSTYFLLGISLLSGCTVGPIYNSPDPSAPDSFHATLPHEGSVTNLETWWSQFDDPLIEEFVRSAQTANPTIAQAQARIAQARAGLASSNSELFPTANATANRVRGKTEDSAGERVLGTSRNTGVDASWEIDLFGAKRKAADAAHARLAARYADWYDIRISLAAEVASTLVSYRTCVETEKILQEDLASREKTAQLTALKIKMGFTAPSDIALMEASTAAGRQQLVSQHAECDLAVKALVALTDFTEPQIREKLSRGKGIPRPKGIVVNSVPAQILAQRPDIASAERELAATSADINVAEANRYPRIALFGSIGSTTTRTGGNTTEATSWSFGPSISLPIFDAGRRKADVEAAQARYDEALAVYKHKVRGAVREIEEALVRLDSAARREADADHAARNYNRFFQAVEDRYKVGSDSLLDLEESRRTALVAKQVLLTVQHERVMAWISLYKALGGGWRPDQVKLERK